MFECESFDVDFEGTHVVASTSVNACCKSRNILGGEGDVLIKGRKSTYKWPGNVYVRCVPKAGSRNVRSASDIAWLRDNGLRGVV